MSGPRFSVVIPSFNRADLLPRAIQSVLAQREADFELLVVDDESSDETEAVVASFTDPRVHYLRQQRSGAGAARNLGARRATGRNLTFLDSDDEALPGWLACFRDLFEDGAAIAFCGIRYVDEGGRLTDSPPVSRGPMFGDWVASFKAGGFALPRDLFLEVGGYHPRLAANQHTELAFRLVDHCRARQLRPAAAPDLLVLSYRNLGGRIRQDPAAVLAATEYILEHHRSRLLRYAGDYADYLAIAGVAASRLGDHQRARRHFARALRQQPLRPKAWLRWLRALLRAGTHPLVGER